MNGMDDVRLCERILKYDLECRFVVDYLIRAYLYPAEREDILSPCYREKHGMLEGHE